MDTVPIFLTNDPSIFLDKVRAWLESNKPARLDALSSQLTRVCVIEDQVDGREVLQGLKAAGILEARGGRLIRLPTANYDLPRAFTGKSAIVIKIAEKIATWLLEAGEYHC